MVAEGGIRGGDGEGELGNFWRDADYQDYITQVLTGLSDLHRQHATQRRKLSLSPG